MKTILNLKTPCGNTGLNCQSDFSVRVDYLNLTFPLPAERHLVDFLEWLALISNDEIVYFRGTPIVRGIRYENTARSVGGILAAWNPGSSAWVSIPGDALAQFPEREIPEVIRYAVVALQGRVTRLDVALDDYRRELSPALISDALESGSTARFRTWSSYRTKTKIGVGWSYYLGSPQSDDRTVIYDKTIESLGRINSIRIERRLKDAKAHTFADNLLNVFDTVENTDYLRFLADSAVGGVDFLDRVSTHLERCPRLQWWAAFLDRLALSPFRVLVPARVKTIASTLAWIEHQVETSLALVQAVFGDRAFRHRLNQWLSSGKRRFSASHLALLNYLTKPAVAAL
jgi:hypothetical protein